MTDANSIQQFIIITRYKFEQKNKKFNIKNSISTHFSIHAVIHLGNQKTPFMLKVNGDKKRSIHSIHY